MRQGEQDAAAADGLKAGLSAAREQNARGAQLVVFDRDGGGAEACKAGAQRLGDRFLSGEVPGGGLRALLGDGRSLGRGIDPL